MTTSPVVLRRPMLEDSIALPTRRPIGPDPRTAAIELALQATRDEGLRQGREQGFATGHAEGLRQGRAAAQEEAAVKAAAIEEEATAQREALQAGLAAAAAAMQSATEQWLVLAEEDMVALCFETIARVLGQAAVTPEGVRAQALQLLDRWRGDGVPVLHVHPADASLFDGLAATRLFTCIADPEVPHGGCLVRGCNGALDARLGRILEEVKAALLAARDEREQPDCSP